MPEQVEGSIRRLAAVWFADIVGYTRMSASDEDSALALVSVLQEVARAEVAAHGGRIVKFIGDAVLAEFQSTEAAVRAALALNTRYEAASTNTGHSSKLRIGVHVGDVLGTPDGDLYGDGINTASRVQGAAEPGYVWVTKDVWSQLHARRDFRFDAVGQKALKGLDNKLSIYSVRFEAKTAETAAAKLAPVIRRSARYARLVRVALLYVVIAGVLVVGTGVLRNFLALPDWVMPGGVLILLIGLAVTLATEWAQSRPSAARKGRFPELTWGRALMGGVFAYTLLFVAAGMYVWVKGKGLADGSPQPASAAVGVVPPTTQAQDSLTGAGAATDTTAVAAETERPAEPIPTAESANSDSVAYGTALGTAEAARRSASTAGAASSQPAFARADSLRTRARAEAGQGRFAEARQMISQARGLYVQAGSNAVLENRVDSLLGALEPLQNARLSATDGTRVRDLRGQAGEAERSGRYQEAIRLLQEVADIYRDAAATQGRAGAPATQPSVPAPDPRPQAPAPQPTAIDVSPVRPSNEEIAAQVLEEMRGAIQRKDITALQAVWSLTPTEVRNFQNSWPAMGNLAVRVEPVSVQAVGDRIIVRTNTTYAYLNTTTRRQENRPFTQTLTIAQQNGRWMIVASGG